LYVLCLQAGKEWRLVTEYLEEIAVMTKPDIKANPESLVEIDSCKIIIKHFILRL